MNSPYELERPANLTAYIQKEVAEVTYLIFNRKENQAYCTRCGKLHSLEEILWTNIGHNEKGWCPSCKAEAVLKEQRYGRKNITEYGRILWFQVKENATYGQLDEYIINYCGLAPEVTYWPSAQYKFTKNEQRYFKHYPNGFWRDERWGEHERIHLPAAYRALFSPSWTRPKYEKSVVYEEQIKLGQDLKYANLDVCYNDNGEMDPYTLIGYISNFLKYSSIELLQKSGFERIVQLRSDGWTCRYINWRGKTLRKILKMNNDGIKALRKVVDDWSKSDLEVYLRVKKEYNIEPKHMAVMGSKYGMDENLDAIAKYTDPLIAVEYLRRQLDRHGGHITIGDYADYLDDCRKLKLDIKEKSVLRPKNFIEAHARASEMIEEVENAKLREDFLKGMKTVYDKGEFRIGNLLIRPAESIDELNKESMALGHCVRTYKDKVARGKCAILFVRKTEEPDKPYYTLELDPKGRIVQCRGLRNCSMTDEVDMFVNAWLKAVVQKKKKGAA